MIVANFNRLLLCTTQCPCHYISLICLDNTGRQFYKCPNRDQSCDFFLWADDACTTNRNSARLTTSVSSVQTRHSSYSTGPQTHTSRQNRGIPSTMTYGSFNSNPPRPVNGNRTNHSSENEPVVICSCGTEAVQRTVQKEGPNKGKQFYTCPKPRDTQCGFFEWADSVPMSNVHSGSSTRRGQGSRRGGTDEQRNMTCNDTRKRKPPTCSVCKQQGHTKRSCPRAKEL